MDYPELAEEAMIVMLLRDAAMRALKRGRGVDVFHGYEVRAERLTSDGTMRLTVKNRSGSVTGVCRFQGG